MEARLSILIAFTLMTGCDQRSSRDAAVANAIKSEPHVAAFDRLFPTAEHSISYYTGQYGQPRWNSTQLLYGRYELAMQFDIDIDRSGTQVTAIEPPHFWLLHRQHVQQLSGGQRIISYQPDGSMEFGLAEWQRLVSAGGDLSVLGIQPITDAPIAETTTPP